MDDAGGVAAREPTEHGSRPVIAGLDSLQGIGQFEGVPHDYAVFGDTDHDGVNEIIFSSHATLRILEYVHYGQFISAFDGPWVIPLAVGDADQDGKSDTVGLGG